MARCVSSAARRTCTRSWRQRIAAFLGTEDAILYASCFDANGGLFETLLGEEDAVISDELNHASIIDGIRLCKAQRYRYRNNDMAGPGSQAARRVPTAPVHADLHRRRVLDGRHDRAARPRFASWRRLRALRDGSTIATPRASWERPAAARTSITASSRPNRHHHRHARQGARRGQRRLHRRPSRSGRAAAAALAALSVFQFAGAGHRRRHDCRARPAEGSTALRDKLRRQHTLVPPGHRHGRLRHQARHASIVPIMVHDAEKAQQLAARLLELGVYVVGFFFPSCRAARPASACS